MSITGPNGINNVAVISPPQLVFTEAVPKALQSIFVDAVENSRFVGSPVTS